MDFRYFAHVHMWTYITRFIVYLLYTTLVMLRLHMTCMLFLFFIRLDMVNTKGVVLNICYT